MKITEQTAIRLIAYGTTANSKGKGQFMEKTEELKQLLKNAYSIESMAGHGAEGRSTTYIGTVEKGNRLYLVYRDSCGACWYETRIRTPQGVVSEYEAIFGKPEKKGAYRKWK